MGKKYPRLTETPKGKAVLHITAGPDAAALNSALETEMQDTGNSNKSEVARQLIINGVRERKAQEWIECALANLDTWEMASRASIVRDMRMILTGCEQSTTTVFTGELSQEYIERYGE